jgi:hypothetical protein
LHYLCDIILTSLILLDNVDDIIAAAAEESSTATEFTPETSLIEEFLALLFLFNLFVD